MIINKQVLDQYIADENYSQALSYIGKDYLNCYSSVDDYIIYTQLLLQNDLYTEALEQLQLASKIYPEVEIFYFRLAAVSRHLNHFDQAKYWLQQLITRFPKNCMALNNLGALYLHTKQYIPAIECYQQALEIQPDYKEAYYNLSLCHKALGNYDQAIICLQALVDFDSYAPALYQLGILRMENGDYEKAIAHFLRLISHHPYHIETLINLSTCFIKANNFDLAYEYLQRVLELDANEEQALYNLALLAEKCHDLSQAEKLYLRILTTNAKHTNANYNLAVIYHKQQKFERALRYYQAVIDCEPKHEYAKFAIHALNGRQIEQPPKNYVAALFNQYAVNYEAHLINELNYQVPRALTTMINEVVVIAPQMQILDLGCGTGLMACQSTWQAHWVGVDIAEHMLLEAHKKNIYQTLHCTDIASFFVNNQLKFDLIIAADVLVYFGRLEELLQNCKAALAKNGLCAFSIESTAKQIDYELTATGRYKHADSYLMNLLEKNHLSLIKKQQLSLRSEQGKDVLGIVYIVKNLI